MDRGTCPFNGWEPCRDDCMLHLVLTRMDDDGIGKWEGCTLNFMAASVDEINGGFVARLDGDAE